MRYISPILAASLAASLAFPAWAADQGKSQPDEAPPPPPVSKPAADADLEPQVTIVQKKDMVVEEYRVAGRLFKIKVTPKVGPPYYLVDERGNGQFTRMDGPDAADMRPPFWLLFRF